MTDKDCFKYYICGLVDGEGSFNVSLQKDLTHKNGFRLKPVFSIGLHRENKLLLQHIQEVFQCGILRRVRSMIVYEVTNLCSFLDKVIPFFEKYELRAKKKSDFELFKEICFLMRDKFHLSPKGYLKVLRIRSKMNRVGKRRKFDI